ncbi:MAG: DUF2339 domain-containing protein [Phycisphaerales bacterium JB039]
MLTEANELRERITRVEARLDAIEAKLAFEEGEGEPEPAPAPPAAPPTMWAPEPSPAPPADRPRLAPRPVQVAAPAVAATDAGGGSESREGRLEKLIGGRLFAAAGGLIIVLGLGFFMKLAYDAGWLGAIPPAARCLAGAGAGVCLLIAGEWARRRAGAWAAAGLNGAGVATLYGSAFIAYGVFGLLGAPVTFVLLAMTAAVGVAIAGRARVAPVAILSTVGAYLAPLLTATEAASPLALPMYLTALLGAGLVLSGRRREVFGALRPICWTATMLLGGLWGLAEGSDLQAALALFVGAIWAMTHAEMLLPARARALDRDAAAPLGWAEARPVLMSLLTTAWATALGVICGGGGWMPTWFVPAGLLVASFALASMTAGALRILRDLPRSESERYGAALMLQAGALLVAVVALALAGWLEVFAWLALGAAGAATARWLRAPSLAVAGAVALGIATVRLLAYDSLAPGLAGVGVEVAGLYLSRWALLMVGAAGAWIVLAIGALGAGWRTPGRVAWGAALAILMLSVVHSEAMAISVAAAWLGLAAALVGFGRARAQALSLWSGVLAGALAMGAALLAWPHWANQPGLLIGGLAMTPWSAVTLLAAALHLGAAAWLIPAPSWRAAALWSALCGVGALALAPLHPESEPLSALWWWTALGAGLTGAARFERRLPLAWLGAAALGLTGLAWAGVEVGAAPASTIAGVRIAIVQAVVIAIAALWAGARLPAQVAEGWPRRGMFIGAGTLLFAASSLEWGRLSRMAFDDVMAQRASISVWWAVFAAALLALGSLRHWRSCRFAGLGLLALAGLKAVTFDLVAIDPAWRVVSLIGTGLVMLAVAVAYGRMATRRGALADSRV